MASAADGHHPNGSSGGFRRLLHLSKAREAPERSPLIRDPSPSSAARKTGFASAAFRGLGCASSSSSDAFSPAAAAVRSSADWQGKRARRRRPKKKERRSSAAGSASADVWCTPGIDFSADVSVDCVVSSRGRPDSNRVMRESPWVARRVGRQEQIPSFMDSPDPEAPLFGSDSPSLGHFRRLRGYRRSPGGLEELVMFQTRLLLGAMDAYDQYRDMRLDVDTMSYEELLELGDRMGHVSTGLREEEIFRCLRRTKHEREIERKCSICQEEFEANDEVGRLECGHSYHLYCIKQWLLQKNACPVCKTAVAES